MAYASWSTMHSKSAAETASAVSLTNATGIPAGWPMAAQKRMFYDTMGRLCSGKIQCQWYIKYEMNLPFHRHIRTFQISLWKSSITFCHSLPDSIWFAGFTPKTPLWQCQHRKVPRHLDVNTHEAPVGENNRISHNSGWLFGNFAMASILIALRCEKMIGQPRLNHKKRDFVSLEVNGFGGIPYCSSPWPSSHRNRHITS